MERKSVLHVEMVGNRSEVEIRGTRSEILFNLAALTNQVCKKINLEPALFSIMLPSLIARQNQALMQATEFDFTATQKQQEGQP